MVPLGALVTVQPTTGPALVTLYNLYPAATIVGAAAPGYSTGEAMALMEQLADKALSPGTSFEWPAMAYQEKAVGG
jgi:HAE1 family hydrophobic/amphiphilic exporter-1